MAHTITNKALHGAIELFGTVVARIVEIDITTYVVGGITVAPADIGLKTIIGIFEMSSEFGYVMRWDEANNKLLVYGQEPTNATVGVIQLTQLTAVDAGKWRVLFLGV